MTTKSYLEQIARYDAMVLNTCEEIENLKNLATSTTVPMDKERVQTSGTSDIVGNNVARYIDLENKSIARWGKERFKIVRQIQSIENTVYYNMLYQRFVLVKSMYEIQQTMSYSKAQCYKILNEAMENFEKKYGKYYLKTRTQDKNRLE